MPARTVRRNRSEQSVVSAADKRSARIEGFKGAGLAVLSYAFGVMLVPALLDGIFRNMPSIITVIASTFTVSVVVGMAVKASGRKAMYRGFLIPSILLVGLSVVALIVLLAFVANPHVGTVNHA